MPATIELQSLVHRSFALALAAALCALWLALPPTVRAASSAGPEQDESVHRAFSPYWIQNHSPTHIWSGRGEEAVAFALLPAWHYFQVVAPQQGSRLHVIDPRSGDYAYVDAVDVGPSGPPAHLEAQAAGASVSGLFQPWWVVNHQPARLWSAPGEDAIELGLAFAWNHFEVLAPQQGSRLRVRDPRTAGAAYVEAASVGPAGAPDALDHPAQWWGYVGAARVNVRPSPDTEGETLGQLSAGTPVLVRQWVEGEAVDNNDPTWAELADGTYLWAPLLQRVALDEPPPPARMLNAEKWIDVNLTLQTVTAYERDSPVYWANTSSGRPGWETPEGLFYVQRRVENEIMDSNTLLGLDAERADYRVEDVRWTQYFTPGGHALHENYWKPPDTFGIPSSHGCLGLLASDAEWFWNWAGLGTPVLIQE